MQTSQNVVGPSTGRCINPGRIDSSLGEGGTVQGQGNFCPHSPPHALLFISSSSREEEVLICLFRVWNSFGEMWHWKDIWIYEHTLSLPAISQETPWRALVYFSLPTPMSSGFPPFFHFGFSTNCWECLGIPHKPTAQNGKSRHLLPEHFVPPKWKLLYSHKVTWVNLVLCTGAKIFSILVVSSAFLWLWWCF